jgi:UDP-3-O-[3-hydroxymyristoyl] glucosamine N-acyltransferase
MRIREIAAMFGAVWEGDGEIEVSSAAPLDTAHEQDAAFVSGKKSIAQAHSSRAGCLLVPMDFINTHNRAVIRVDDPRGAMARLIERLYPPCPFEAGLHPTACVAASARIEDGVSIGPHADIGEGAVIGRGTRIGPGCSVGSGVRLGSSCLLHANVALYAGVQVGDRAILHSGCVIGADGFGFVFDKDRYRKFPQVGRVLIGNDVEIGANACVDRGALGETVIGDGTKLDNMVHIGHNCRIGRHVVIAAQTGLSGGVVVEDYAIIGGQVGIGDKARIKSRAVIGSGAGVLTSKVVHAGEVMWGTPARPLKEHLEQLASLGRLPELRRQIKQLQDALRKTGRE